MNLVVDASVAVKWLVDEPGSDDADGLKVHDLWAPSLIRVEVANTLATLQRRGALTARYAEQAFLLFQSAPVRIVEPEDSLERAAVDMALRLGHPVYDCLYLAVARRLNATLVSADRRFLDRLAQTTDLASTAVHLGQL